MKKFLKKDTQFLHSAHNVGLLIILISLVVFATALVGSLTGASVYYQYKQTPIFKDPSSVKTTPFDSEIVSTHRIVTDRMYSPGALPLSLASQQGVVLEDKTSLTVHTLSGEGNAYACLDQTGQFYRSDIPCR